MEPDVDVRALLLEELRELEETFGGRFPASEPETFFTSPWPAEIAALEAGEPLVVAGWQVNEWLAVRPDANAHFRLEPDGSLTPVRPVHRGDHVAWED